MSIGQALAGAALVGTAMYLNRSADPRRGPSSAGARLAFRLARVKELASDGRCHGADMEMDYAWEARDALEHNGRFTASDRREFQMADREVARCFARSGSGMNGLGDDPLAPPAGGDYDPRKADKAAFLRTHLAKKFWGSTVLAAQSSTSMRKLSHRIRKFSTTAADDALRVADDAWKLHVSTLSLAQKYNADWVKAHATKTDTRILEEPDSRRDARMDE